MRRRKDSGNDETELDMTPMLDLVFIMLIFFVVTSTFLQETGISMLPSSNQNTEENQTQAKSILVQIDQNSTVFVNGRLTDPERVTALVQRANVDNGGQSGVVIQPDPDAEHGVVTTVYDAANAAGVVGGVTLREPERSAIQF